MNLLKFTDLDNDIVLINGTIISHMVVVSELQLVDIHLTSQDDSITVKLDDVFIRTMNAGSVLIPA